MPPLAYLVLTYLVCSVSGPQLIARLHGVDLHLVGTRNLGGGNLGREVNAVAGITGGLVDALKPAVAMLVARALGADHVTEAFCGVVGVAAQQWPIWHRFDGGRGNAPMFALLIGLWIPATILAAVIVFAGLAVARAERRAGKRWSAGTPVGVLLAFAAYPFLVRLTGGGEVASLAGATGLALILVRRLTAGIREDLSLTDDLARVVRNRLLFNRSETQARAT